MKLFDDPLKVEKIDDNIENIVFISRSRISR